MKVALWLSLMLVVLVAAGSIIWRFLARDDEPVPDARSIRMEVFNGCGIPRVGRAVAEELQMRGYDVYTSGNAPKHHRRTTVLDLRDPHCRNAGKVARSLKVQHRVWGMRIGRPAVPDSGVAIDSSRFVEVRLVVGDDFRRFFPKAIPLH